MADLCTLIFLWITYTLKKDLNKDYSKGQKGCFILVLIGIGFIMFMLVYQLVLSIIGLVKMIKEYCRKQKERKEKEEEQRKQMEKN